MIGIRVTFARGSRADVAMDRLTSVLYSVLTHIPERILP